MTRIEWTPERAEWFASFVPGHTEREISAEHERLFGSPLTEGQIGNAKARFGVKSGTHGGRFEKGRAGGFKDEAHRRAFLEAGKATRFKKGEVHGPEGHVKPVGYERVDAKDGYVWVKVKDTPQTGFNDNFRPKHHIVWEQANGKPVPKHSMIVFADRDKRNFEPANLVAVPRALWAIITHEGWAYHDRDSLKTCIAMARLKKAARAKLLAPRFCKACGAEFSPRFERQRTCDVCLGRAEP